MKPPRNGRGQQERGRSRVSQRGQTKAGDRDHSLGDGRERKVRRRLEGGAGGRATVPTSCFREHTHGFESRALGAFERRRRETDGPFNACWTCRETLVQGKLF